MGSPPHVRERLQNGIILCRYVGITPACAGKTGTQTVCPRWPQDHPRMCGKDPYTSVATSFTSGSPPHVRERPL